MRAVDESLDQGPGLATELVGARAWAGPRHLGAARKSRVPASTLLVIFFVVEILEIIEDVSALTPRLAFSGLY